jgi:hypothetical protein
MTPFSLEWREVLAAAGVFGLTPLAFALLAGIAGWPNSASGWPLAVGVALSLALLRVIGPLLDFLRRAGAKVETPFGLKLDFAGVARMTVNPQPWILSDTLVRKGTNISESTVGDLESSVQEFADQPEIVIDLEDGQAWYTTRIFAVAATADIIGSPEAIVFVGQRNGLARQFGGWCKPSDVVTAFERHDPRFAGVREVALRYWAALKEHAHDSGYAPQAALPQYYSYRQAFLAFGESAIIRIFVSQMRNPDVPTPQGPLEPSQEPPWIMLGQIEALMEPWLIRAHVDIRQSAKE